MSWKCEPVQDRMLRAASNDEAFKLHLAALEWSLIDPIVINSEEDIKATNWRDRGLKPFKHQVQNLITYCRRLPVALIADDVGLGKTISAGLILSELITRRRVQRALVLCPSVLIPQWVAELDQKFGIVAVEAKGADLSAQFGRSTPVVVTTYETARARLEKIEPGMFDFCILDEAHKLRNLHGTQKPPVLAKRVRDALERRPFRYVLMLTATPVQNRVWDLYSLIDLLKVAEGTPNPLGRPDEFAAKYLEPGTQGRKLRANVATSFQAEVRGSLTRTRRADVQLRFPERCVQLAEVSLEAPELQMIGTVAKIIGHLPPLSQVSLAQAMMSSPRALLAQAENMADKLPANAVADLRAAASCVPVPAKLKMLMKVLEQLRSQESQNWRALIFTVRRETQEMIGTFLRQHGIACGFIRGADAAANQRSIDGYSAAPPSVHVIVSTDAGAEGVNLQAGNVVINYDLPWNPMVVEQRIGRVQRLGSSFAKVLVVNLVGSDTVESRIVARLSEKLQGICQAIGDVEGILEAADLDEDSTESFETRMRKMVVDALQGYDTRAATALMEKNINEALRLFEERRVELDQTLGNPKEGVLKATWAAPRVERKPPRLDVKEFVLGTYRQQGFEPKETEPEVYEMQQAGRPPERVSFKEVDGERAVFANQLTRVCLPGKPGFERLVQHWVDHHALRYRSHLPFGTASARIQAQRWCTNFGSEFVEATYTPHTSSFQGRVHLRVQAGNGVDSFEKLLVGRLPRPRGHGALPENLETVAVDSDQPASSLLPQLSQSICRHVEQDEEIKQFCNFYLARLSDALQEAGIDARQSAKVRSDLQPIVHADIVALDGPQSDSGTVPTRSKMEGREYASELDVVPASGDILREPKREACAVTGRKWPVDCLEACAETKALALKHRLERAPDGQYVLPDQIVTCALTGERMLKSETARASSGKVVRKDLLIRCAESGNLLLPEEVVVSDMSGRRGSRARAVISVVSRRIGLADEGVTCAATGRVLLRDEAVVAADGRWFAADQLVQSAMSGEKALPEDMVTCELTGDRVLPQEAARCAASGRMIRRDRLTASHFSGVMTLPEHLVDLHDGRRVLPHEAGTCDWQGGRCLRTELARCTLTQACVAKNQLNSAGELQPLRQLLDGQVLGLALPKEDLHKLLQVTGWKIAANATAFRLAAPAPGVYAVVIEERGWLGFGLRVLGAVVEFNDTALIRGHGVAGKRKGSTWVAK
ncbi:MAG TPA: SNF2-related protein [Gemmatales bacterium]|nr:SNF2-related protein [Gemmatales bacterium]